MHGTQGCYSTMCPGLSRRERWRATTILLALISKHIRFDPQAWDYISREAAHLGMPAAEFVRTAALARAAFCISQRDPEEGKAFSALYAAAHEVAEKFDGDGS